jgi:hypothetical protein
MTLILNGTDNSATTPAVTGTDTDTGVYYPAANQVALATNGTLALIVNSSQQVGIGGTPTARLQVFGEVGGATCIFGVGANGNGGIVWRNASNTSVGYMQVNSDNVEYRTTNDSTGVYMQKAGLTFPATQFPSADANTLDDYEEGSINTTVTLGSGTITSTISNTLNYTKIGRQVTVTGRLYVNLSTSNVTSFRFTLPFVVGSANAMESAALFQVIRATTNATVGFTGYRIFRAEVGFNTVTMQQGDGADTGDFGTTSPHINVNITYFIN